MDKTQIEQMISAVENLANSDPEAAAVIHRFLDLVNADDRNQSAASLTLHLGMAMSECEDEITHQDHKG